MLQNLIPGNYKFILIVDNTGLESQATNLIENIIGTADQLHNLALSLSTKCPYTLANDTLRLGQIPTDGIILIPISTFCHHFRAFPIFKLIHQLKNTISKSVFGWASTKHIENGIIVPYLEHMANAIITFRDMETLSVLMKKSGGSVIKKFYQYTIQNNELKVNEVQPQSIEKIAETEINPEALATFKITAEDEELVARNALKLPYERSNPSSDIAESKIIYNPDSDDDFDEEDPDEDLYI